MKKLYLATLLLLNVLSADSINLFNDSSYTLKAIIYDSSGTQMGEFILNPRDASEWNNNYENATANNTYQAAAPYTVAWLCMQGSQYGSCNYVAAGSTVTAQSCGGAQQCPSSSTNAGASPSAQSP